MEFILQLLLILTFLIIIPFLLGSLFTHFSEKSKNSIALSFLFGFVAMLSIYELLALPMTFLKLPLQTLTISWACVVVGLCIVSACLTHKDFSKTWNHLKSNLKALPWLAILVIVLVILQAAVLTLFMHTDDDDAFYVGTAATALQTNTIYEFNPYTGELLPYIEPNYILSLFPVFCAVLSSLTGVHVAIFMHTILPAVLIPLSYFVYYEIGKELFHKDKQKTFLFLFFVCIVNIFGYVSIYTASTFLLFRIWQGKAILASILLPFIFLLSMRTMLHKAARADWIFLFLTMIASATVSSMGIFLAPLLLGILAIVFSIAKKSWRSFLYSLLCCTPNIALGITKIMLSLS
ncbi:MAG: DUF6077 domain-containing protein [Christensenellaceae bacterium]